MRITAFSSTDWPWTSVPCNQAAWRQVDFQVTFIDASTKTSFTAIVDFKTTPDGWFAGVSSSTIYWTGPSSRTTSGVTITC